MTISLPFAWLGPQEMIPIFLIILLLFGAKKLPELARGLGKSLGEFKKAREDFEGEIQRAGEEVELEKESSIKPAESSKTSTKS